MGHRTNQFSVLDNWTSAHPLDYPSCFPEQFLIRHFYDQSFVDFCLRHVDICHLNIIFLKLVVDKAPDRGIAFYDFFFFCSFYRNLFFKQIADSVDCSIYPCVCILINSAQNIEIIVNNNETTVKIGKVFTSDKFYNSNENLIKEKNTGALGVEMETLALYTNAKISNKNAIAMFTVSDAPLRGESLSADDRQNTFDEMIKIALELAISL